MSEGGVIRGNTHGASKRQIQPPAQAIAANGRHGRERGIVNLVDDRLAERREVAGRMACENAHLLDISTRSEGLGVGGYHHTVKQPR